MDRLRLRANEGFTLIELLVVIAIIGILAAIAIPQFAAYRRRGFDADAQSAVRNLATAQEAYFVQNQAYTSAVANLMGAGGFNYDPAHLTVTTTPNGNTFTATAANVPARCTAGGIAVFNSVQGKITLTPCT